MTRRMTATLGDAAAAKPAKVEAAPSCRETLNPGTPRPHLLNVFCGAGGWSLLLWLSDHTGEH